MNKKQKILEALEEKDFDEMTPEERALWVEAYQDKQKKQKPSPPAKKKRIPKAPPNFSTRKLLSLNELVSLESLRTGSYGAKEIKKIGVKWFNEAEGYDLEEIDQAFTDKAIFPYHKETLENCIKGLISFLTEKGDSSLKCWFEANLKKNVVPMISFWRGGMKFTQPEQNQKESKPHYLARVFRGFLTFTVVDAFEGKNASLFLGVCPRCERVFIKNRSDEMYDRKTCQVEATRGNTKK